MPGNGGGLIKPPVFTWLVEIYCCRPEGTSPTGMAFSWRGCSLPTTPPPVGRRPPPPLSLSVWLFLNGWLFLNVWMFWMFSRREDGLSCRHGVTPLTHSLTHSLSHGKIHESTRTRWRHSVDTAPLGLYYNFGRVTMKNDPFVCWSPSDAPSSGFP